MTSSRTTLTMLRYAGNFMRKLEANMREPHPDFESKAGAFFQYATHDEQMVSLLKKDQNIILITIP